MNCYFYLKNFAFSLLVTIIPTNIYSQEVSSHLPIDLYPDFDQKKIKRLPVLLSEQAELFQKAILDNKLDVSLLEKNTQEIQALYSFIYGTIKGKDFNPIFQRYCALLLQYIQAAKSKSAEARLISQQLLETSNALGQFLENSDLKKVTTLAIQETDAYLKGYKEQGDHFHQELLNSLQELSSHIVSSVE